MTALDPKADIRLVLSFMTANDPYRTFGISLKRAERDSILVRISRKFGFHSP